MDLQTVISDHQKWLEDRNTGCRADLRGRNLRGSDLRGSNLRGSDLSDSYLRGSDLSGSDLSGSDLSGSNLSNSNLRGSNLSGSDLSDSDLSGSDLSGSNLSSSDLRGSNLRGSDLSGSDLSGSNLSRVYGQTFITIGNIGSRNSSTIYHIESDTIWCGCWRSNLVEFESRVHYIYGDEFYGLQYQSAIRFIKEQLAIKSLKHANSHLLIPVQ